MTMHTDVKGRAFFTDGNGIAYGGIETVNTNQLEEGSCPPTLYLELKQLFEGLSVAPTPGVDSEKPNQFADAYFLFKGYQVVKVEDTFYLVGDTETFTYSGFTIVEGNENNPARVALRFVQDDVECAKALAAATATRIGTATMTITPLTTGTLPPAARQSETPQPPHLATGTPRPPATGTLSPPNTPRPENTVTPASTNIPAATITPKPPEATATQAPTNVHKIPTATQGSVPTSVRVTATDVP